MELPLGCEPVVGAMSSLISFDSSAQALWSRAASSVEAVEEVQQHRSRSCSTDTENELEQPQRSVIRLPKISSLFSPPRSANGIQGTEPRRLHARVGLEEVS